LICTRVESRYFVENPDMAQPSVAEVQVDDLTGEFDELKPGTELLKGQYTITGFLNSGGFGITYLARDSLNRTVVIKECFIGTFSRRSKNLVMARSRAYQGELRSVVHLFIREAKNLARLVHPNIVAVHQVFEDNGTAYMALDYIEGRDLLEAINDGSSQFAPDEVVRMTEKLLSAVKFIHENGMLHRDISPDNVLINRTGEPILIDFGAAREDVAQAGRPMTTMRIVKDGYSPQEFYVAGSAQGPYSDLYALGATLYHLITREAPTNAQVRLTAIAEDRADPYQPLAGRFAGYPKGFLEAIDTALKCLPKERVQSASDWLAMFRTPGVLPIYPERHRLPVPQAPATPPVEAAPSETVEAAVVAMPAPKGKKSTGLLLGGLVAAAVAAGLAFVMSGNPDVVAKVPASETPAAQPLAIAQADAAVAAVVADEPVEVVAVAPEVADVPQDPVVASAVEATDEISLAEDAVAAEEVAALPATEPAPAAVAPEVPLAAQQIGFAAWDVRMPFFEANRIVGGKPSMVISRIDPTADLAIAGNWLQPGITITAVNDALVSGGATVASLILGNLTVDPDGYARAAIRYVDTGGQAQAGLLAVPTLRLVSLANGVSLVASHEDGRWVTKVKSIETGAATTLQEGDVIFREKSTGTTFDNPQSIEAVMPALIERKLGTVEFSIIRDAKLDTAFMQLAIDGTASAD
jgi:serine/threonine protein kinase